MISRRNFNSSALAASFLGLSASAKAQSYPSRSIRWIVPFPPGGPVDSIARRAGDVISSKLGQTIVIDNKPGAGGVVGTAEMSRARADGYTFCLATSDTLVSPAFLMKAPGYDARKDLSLVGKLCHAQPVLMVSASSGIRDLNQLIAAAKAKPKSISYAHWGPGTVPHLYMKSLETAAGVEFLDVSYKGTMQALQDMLGGQITLILANAGLALPYVQKGQVNVISVSGGNRIEQFPQVATVQEQGFDAPMFRFTYWAGLVAPKGLPDAIATQWNRLLHELPSSQEFKSTLATLGMVPSPRLGADFLADLNWEFDVTGNLVRTLRIQPE